MSVSTAQRSNHRRQRRLFVQDRFEQWLNYHRDNPRVYMLFRDLTRQAFRAEKKFGARCIWENIRWKLQFETRIDPGEDEFVMNDHHVPYYARLVMLRHPELEGYFERRDARFDVDDATLLGEANEIDRRRDVVTGE